MGEHGEKSREDCITLEKNLHESLSRGENFAFGVSCFSGVEISSLARDFRKSNASATFPASLIAQLA
jgi:hypothetical protein